MNLSQLANPRILEQPVYEPGKPIEAVAREHGLELHQICKLASNENPWGASELAKEAACHALTKVHLYPDGSGNHLIQRLAKLHCFNEQQFVLGNGSNEIIELLGHVFLEPGDEVICGEHAFVVYQLVALLMGAKPVQVEMPGLAHDLELMSKAVTDRTKLVFLPSPNNPTGTYFPNKKLFSLLKSVPEYCLILLDQAYEEYLPKSEIIPLKKWLSSFKNIIVTRTFSKAYGLAAFRVGWGAASSNIIEKINRIRQPFNVNSFGLNLATHALSDQTFINKIVKSNCTYY